MGQPTATDNCTGNVTISYTGEQRLDGACPSSYSLIRRWVATDDCGNSVEAEQRIEVQDLTSPDFTFVPSDMTVECDAVATVGVATAIDNCTPFPGVEYAGETREKG